MSNLYRQVRGEWVELSEKEAEQMYSSKRGPITNIRQYFRRFVG